MLQNKVASDDRFHYIFYELLACDVTICNELKLQKLDAQSDVGGYDALLGLLAIQVSLKYILFVRFVLNVS